MHIPLILSFKLGYFLLPFLVNCIPRKEMAMQGLLPVLAMVILQLGYTGMNTTSKLAMEYSNMKPLVLVAYRQIFATVVMVPFAYFLERKTRPKITMSVLFQIFLCSLTGQETVGIKRITGQAKVIGTLLCVGGAMFLTFYDGPIIHVGESKIHWKYGSNSGDHSSHNQSNSVLGSLIVIASTISWAVWYIIQAKVSDLYPAHYTSTLLMCFMGSIQCAVIGACVNHHKSDWSLNSPIRLVASLYAGICTPFSSLLGQYKGKEHFMSQFSVLYFSFWWLLLVGPYFMRRYMLERIVVGSFLIVLGLYAVLWGKDKETKTKTEGISVVTPLKITEGSSDLELQVPKDSGSNKELIANVEQNGTIKSNKDEEKTWA
ncbi:hypothetical protein Tsubulata_045647 [Turnera subulata]|uniref:WAT1-related protein n=1 Tax=Turnera subulata TaxID=218843 RepID=A0A9Q0G741_9ROSI|nr:hypothetical protein Tsubulata_045647 [Turnera subulata]